VFLCDLCYCLGGNATGNYQILTPAYYDQSGQFVVSGNAARTPVRLVSPAPILVNTATGQQGYYYLIMLYHLMSSRLLIPENLLVCGWFLE